MMSLDTPNHNVLPLFTGVTALANTIPHMGAMLKLDVSKNKLCAAGAKVLAEALRGNQVMTEINISSNHLGKKSMYGDATDMSGVIMLADVIPGMGALLVLSLKSNGLLNKESGRALADALKANSILTELDVSSNYDQYNTSSQDGPGFAQELAVGIRDNGALIKLDISNNDIGAEQNGSLKRICVASSIDLAM
jgi:Ran GTPase-activating protein (RanGAP) involved in mRNA processing and transport